MESYNELYLSDNLKITKYLLHEFIKSGHDFNSCVKKYMIESPIRAKMDEGNWSALNKGINQVYASQKVYSNYLTQKEKVEKEEER